MEARKKMHKTLRQTAREVGVSPALLSLIENGLHRPSKELVVNLAVALDGDGDLWCGLLGEITPDAEKRLSSIARDDPAFFRSMVNRLRT